MLEFFEEIPTETVDIVVDAKVHVVGVRLAGVVRVQLTAHGELRVDVTVTIELPAMHVLVPATLKLRGDDQARCSEVAGGLHLDLDRLGVDRRIPDGAGPGIGSVLHAHPSSLYVILPGRLFEIALGLGLALFVGGIVFYFLRRPTARRLVWPETA
jgi:hypothetical protein